jgi:hypothetical protein
MPVMPLPGVFPVTGAAQNSGLFAPPAAPQPQLAPTWQNPGLGQTILESLPQTQPVMQSMPAMATGPESFLPQRRNEGQAPFSGNLLSGNLGGAQPQPAWGSGIAGIPSQETSLPPQRPSNPATQSGLIPGAPTLPMMGGGFGDVGQGGNLLSRGIPSAPLTNPSREESGNLTLPPATGHVSSRTRPMAKPKRATNVFMIGLALVFLGGFLLAAGWLFREPILQLVDQVRGSAPEEAPATKVADIPPPVTLDGTANDGAASESLQTAPKLASTAPTQPSSGFDPDEAPPQATVPVPPLTAPLKTADETAMVRKAEPVPALPEPTTPTVTAPNAPRSGGLVEVKPAPADGISKADQDPANLAAVPGREVQMDHLTEEAKPAAEALKKFLGASNLKERLQYTLAADMMRSTMERYYSVNADGPVTVDAIALVRYDPKPQVGGGAHAVFGLESRTWEFAVPVMLEMHEGHFKVDWLSFIEFKDRFLEKFLSGYQEGSARFHVGITRTHYFEDKVPNASNKDAFRISPAPPNPFSSVVFVDRDSDLGRELRDKITWGAQVWAIVELEWTKLGPQSWVQLAAVPQLNWYSVPNAPKAQRTPASSPIANDAEVPTETQKAVPVGR